MAVESGTPGKLSLLVEITKTIKGSDKFVNLDLIISKPWKIPISFNVLIVYLLVYLFFVYNIFWWEKITTNIT